MTGPSPSTDPREVDAERVLRYQFVIPAAEGIRVPFDRGEAVRLAKAIRLRLREARS